jgi:hypothetical protein
LPEHSLVTSRFNLLSPKKMHYALVCLSKVPIAPSQPVGKIVLEALMNIRTGRPIGASQVTAVVQSRSSDLSVGKEEAYDVTIRAELVHPYFIKLRHPVVLPTPASFQATNEEWTSHAFQLVRSRRQRSAPGPRQTVIVFREGTRTVTSG